MIGIFDCRGALKRLPDQSRRGIQASQRSRQHSDCSQAISLTLDCGIHVFEEASHFLNWTNGYEFNHVCMTQDP